MASGSTLTLVKTGGNMVLTQVVAGTDTVLASDYNTSLKSPMDTLLGSSTSPALNNATWVPGDWYGWNAGGAVGANTATTSDTINATGVGTNGSVRNLQDSVQSASLYLGNTLETGVGTDIVAGNTITAAFFNNLMLDIEDLWNGRFSPASSTSTSSNPVNGLPLSFSNTATLDTAFTFASATDFYEFFIKGCGLGVDMDAASGSGAVGTAWVNSITAVDTVVLYVNSITSGAGTPSSWGVHNLSTAFKTLLTYNISSAPYTTDTIVVQAKVNSTTAPTVLTFRTIYTDTGDNNVDANPSFTSQNYALKVVGNSNGSGFNFNKTITVSQGSWSIT